MVVNETQTGFVSDPVGGSYCLYTPTEVGQYTIVAKFVGKTLDNTPGGMSPSGLYAGSQMSASSNVTDIYGDYFLPSQSEPLTLTVTEDPVARYQETSSSNRLLDTPNLWCQQRMDNCSKLTRYGFWSSQCWTNNKLQLWYSTRNFSHFMGKTLLGWRYHG